MKKCPKCGVELPDDAAFCNNCGENLAEKPADAPAEEKKEEPVVAPVSENNQVLENAKEANKNTKIGLIAVVGVVAILALIVVCVLISSMTGPKAAIKKYMKAFQDGDAKTLYTDMPEKCLDEYYDDIYEVSFKEYVKAITPVYKEMWSSLKDEGKVKFTYEIKACENVNKLKDLKKDGKKAGIKDLKDLQELLDDEFDDYDLDSKKIKKAYLAEVKWELTVDGDKAIKETETIIVYQYGGKYYVAGGPNYASIRYGLDRNDYDDVIEDIDDALEDFYDEID